MSERILNWGLLSTANINRALITPLRASPRNRLTAVASRDLAHAQAYAAERDIPRAFGSYEAMLADPDIDVVYISLPNSLHAEWSIKAMQAGKHVLCEKPLAVTLAEVDAMTAAARSTGRVLAEAFMYRHHPQTLKVKELVESGAIGRLQVIRGGIHLPAVESRQCAADPGTGRWGHLGCRLLPHQLHPHHRRRGPGRGLRLAGDGRVGRGRGLHRADALPERRPGAVRQRVPLAGAHVDGVPGQRGRAQPDQLLQARPQRRDQPPAQRRHDRDHHRARGRSSTSARSRTCTTPSCTASRRASPWPTAGSTWRRSWRCCSRRVRGLRSPCDERARPEGFRKPFGPCKVPPAGLEPATLCLACHIRFP